MYLLGMCSAGFFVEYDGEGKKIEQLGKKNGLLGKKKAEMVKKNKVLVKNSGEIS